MKSSIEALSKIELGPHVQQGKRKPTSIHKQTIPHQSKPRITNVYDIMVINIGDLSNIGISSA